jgi:hypothetical protein
VQLRKHHSSQLLLQLRALPALKLIIIIIIMLPINAAAHNVWSLQPSMPPSLLLQALLFISAHLLLRLLMLFWSGYGCCCGRKPNLAKS